MRRRPQVCVGGLGGAEQGRTGKAGRVWGYRLGRVWEGHEEEATGMFIFLHVVKRLHVWIASQVATVR